MGINEKETKLLLPSAIESSTHTLFLLLFLFNALETSISVEYNFRLTEGEFFFVKFTFLIYKTKSNILF